MKRKSTLCISAAAADLMLLAVTASVIALPHLTSEGALSGIRLCLNTLIPSLFPFFVLSGLAVETGAAQRLGRLLQPLTRRVLHLPGSCAIAPVLGLVSGYPLGGAVTAELYGKGLCTRDEAERMLAMCSNSGPAFLFGVAGAGVLGFAGAGLLLYCIHILASCTVCLILRPRTVPERCPPAGERHACPPLSACFTHAVGRAFQSVMNVCAFVIFFCVLLSLGEHFGLVQLLAQPLGRLAELLGLDGAFGLPLARGVLELSTGVTGLTGIGSPGGRLVFASFLLGWGGLSVHFQTMSFVSGSGLRIRRYLLGKLLHGALSAALAMLAARMLAVGAFPGSSWQLVRAISLFFIMDFAAAAAAGCLLAAIVRLVKKRRTRLKKKL